MAEEFPVDSMRTRLSYIISRPDWDSFCERLSQTWKIFMSIPDPMPGLDLIASRPDPNAPSFTLKNRLMRVIWRCAWMVLARWTPPPLHRWRVALLNCFGARVAATAHVYSSAEIWAPWNLEMAAYASLGPRVRCYNIAAISLGYKSMVSQNAHLCTGSHDYRDPMLPLTARPIVIGRRAWVCADAFVGPGVTVGDGAVLAAASVAFKDLYPWTVYLGNPAGVHRERPPIDD
jgi:putative colanic acid biosynthesis acetyltransferase WcaF